MEAALRTAVELVTGESAWRLWNFTDVRGTDGIKEATYEVGGLDAERVRWPPA